MMVQRVVEEDKIKLHKHEVTLQYTLESEE